MGLVGLGSWLSGGWLRAPFRQFVTAVCWFVRAGLVLQLARRLSCASFLLTKRRKKPKGHIYFFNRLSLV